MAGIWICRECGHRADSLTGKVVSVSGTPPWWWYFLPQVIDFIVLGIYRWGGGRRQTAEYDRYDRPDCPQCAATGGMQFYDLPPSKAG